MQRGIDVIYGKETPFLTHFAKSKAILARDGKDMLIYQGVLAFQYFIGINSRFEQIENIMTKGFLAYLLLFSYGTSL